MRNAERGKIGQPAEQGGKSLQKGNDMKIIDRQATVYIYGDYARRAVYTDGKALFVKWYGEMVEVERRSSYYVSRFK